MQKIKSLQHEPCSWLDSLERPFQLSIRFRMFACRIFGNLPSPGPIYYLTDHTQQEISTYFFLYSGLNPRWNLIPRVVFGFDSRSVGHAGLPNLPL